MCPFSAVPLIQHMDSRIMIPTKASPLQWNETLTRGWYEVAPFWMLHHPQSIVTRSWTVLLVPPIIISSLVLIKENRGSNRVYHTSKIYIVLASYSPRIPCTFFVCICWGRGGGSGAGQVNLVDLNLIVAMLNVVCHILKLVQEERSSRSSESTTVTWKYEQLHDVGEQSRLSLMYTTVAIYLLKVHFGILGLEVCWEVPLWLKPCYIWVRSSQCIYVH